MPALRPLISNLRGSSGRRLPLLSPQAWRGTSRLTGLLQLGDVQQGAVLGAAQCLLQALQAQGELLLRGGLAAGLGGFLQPLGRGHRAAQQPVEGAEQGSAQRDALLSLAVAAAEGQEGRHPVSEPNPHDVPGPRLPCQRRARKPAKSQENT